MKSLQQASRPCRSVHCQPAPAIAFVEMFMQPGASTAAPSAASRSPHAHHVGLIAAPQAPKQADSQASVLIALRGRQVSRYACLGSCLWPCQTLAPSWEPSLTSHCLAPNAGQLQRLVGNTARSFHDVARQQIAAARWDGDLGRMPQAHGCAPQVLTVQDACWAQAGHVLSTIKQQLS